MTERTCELCGEGLGETLYQDERLRVILVDDPDYPAFCRVIWRAHIKEMTDLAPGEQAYLFQWVMRTEAALRSVLQPDKINLASFGNVVPHMHWHIIPRWQDDRHFPEPVWGSVHRENKVPRAVVGDVELAEALARALAYLEAGR